MADPAAGAAEEQDPVQLAEQAALFGDEIAARAELNLAAHLPTREVLGVLVRHASAGAGSSAPGP